MIGIGHRKLEQAILGLELDGLAAAIGGNGGDAVNGRGKGRAVDIHLLVVVLGRHPVIVGEGAFDELAQEHHRADGEADLGVADFHRHVAIGAVEEFLDLTNGLFRHDDAGHALGAIGGLDFGARHAVAVGGHGAQHGAQARDVDGVEIDAVEVVAGLFIADGELGALDQLAQRGGRHGELMAEAARLEIGEAVGRQARQVKARAARGQHHVLAAIGFEAHFGAIGQLADDFIERMGRHRGGARGRDHGGDRFGHLDIKVGGAQLHLVIAGLEQHVGENGVCVPPLHDPVHMAQRLEQMIAFERDFHAAISLALRGCVWAAKTPGKPGLDIYNLVTKTQVRAAFCPRQMRWA